MLEKIKQIKYGRLPKEILLLDIIINDLYEYYYGNSTIIQYRNRYNIIIFEYNITSKILFIDKKTYDKLYKVNDNKSTEIILKTNILSYIKENLTRNNLITPTNNTVSLFNKNGKCKEIKIIIPIDHLF